MQTQNWKRGDIESALYDCYLQSEVSFLDACSDVGSGACSLSVVLKNKKLYIANAGDCRAVLFKVIYQATGHRADVREFESKRISDFRPRLHISFVRPHRNTGDQSANCRIFEPLRFSYFARRSPVGRNLEFLLFCFFVARFRTICRSLVAPSMLC